MNNMGENRLFLFSVAWFLLVLSALVDHLLRIQWPSFIAQCLHKFVFGLFCIALAKLLKLL